MSTNNVEKQLDLIIKLLEEINMRILGFFGKDKKEMSTSEEISNFNKLIKEQLDFVSENIDKYNTHMMPVQVIPDNQEDKHIAKQMEGLIKYIMEKEKTSGVLDAEGEYGCSIKEAHECQRLINKIKSKQLENLEEK